MSQRHQLSMDSYDRLLLSQDAMPRILRYSMKPQAAASIPSEQDLVVYMTKVADAVVAFIVAQPDGRRTMSG
jgi:hypothetical protein